MKRARTLHARLVLHVVLASTLFALLAGVGVYRWIYARALHDGAQTLQALAVAVERTAAVGAYANDPILLQELADGLARNPTVAAVGLRAGTRLVLGRRNGHALPAPQANAATGAVRTSLASPFDAAERVGELQLDPDLQVLAAGANQQASAVAGLLIALTALVALIVNAAAQRLVAQPIARLSADLARLAPGTAERLPMPTGHDDDEIGALVASTNQLLRSNQVTLERERGLRAEVEAMEAQYRRIFDSSSAGIFVLDGDGRLINGNPTVFRVLGCTEDEWKRRAEQNFIERIFANPEHVRARVDESGRTGRAVSGDFELLGAGAAGGSAHWVHCIFSVQAASTPAERTFVEGVLYDVTERRRAEDEARHVADHDALTGLLNRNGCASLVASWRPGPGDLEEEPYTVLFIDLDGFKAVNDRLGHGAGDRVLRETAERLQASVRRSTDLVSRSGGDEFVIVLRGLRPADPAVAKIADQIGRSLQQPIQATRDEAVYVGVSIGLASFPLHAGNLEAVLQRADIAMYEVKRTGKNSFAMALRGG